MKKLIVSMLIDFGIFAVIALILLFLSMPWKEVISFSMTAYATIEIIRILIRKDIPYSLRSWLILFVGIADFLCYHFLLKGRFEIILNLKICGLLLAGFVARLQLQEENNMEQEKAELGTDAKGQPEDSTIEAN